MNDEMTGGWRERESAAALVEGRGNGYYERRKKGTWVLYRRERREEETHAYAFMFI